MVSSHINLLHDVDEENKKKPKLIRILFISIISSVIYLGYEGTNLLNIFYNILLN